MWQKDFSKIYSNITKEQLWRAWADVANWPKWDTELDYCELDSDFTEGQKFILKPKGGPKVTLFISKIILNKHFTDYCKFIGATMYDAHTLEETVDGIKITNTISVKGPLGFIWANLVAKNVAKSIPKQTDNLVTYARTLDV